jgi:hypothetical protein
MSLYLFLASDKPLKNVKNKKIREMSVNEALKRGLIIDTAALDKMDRDEESAILFSETEKDFSEIEITEDDSSIYAVPFTHKKHVSEIRWDYSNKRAEQLMEYIREHLTEAEEIELWKTWMDDVRKPEVTIVSVGDLTHGHIREIFGTGYYGQPACLIITKDINE